MTFAVFLFFLLPFLAFSPLELFFVILLYLRDASPWSSGLLLVSSETLHLLASYADPPSVEPTKNRKSTRVSLLFFTAAVLKTISGLPTAFAAHHRFVVLDVLLPLGQKRPRDVLCRVRSTLLGRRRLTHCRLLQLEFNPFHLLSPRGLPCPLFLHFCFWATPLVILFFIGGLLTGGPVAQGHPQCEGEGTRFGFLPCV